MKLLIYVPLARGSTRGNWISARRWQRILQSLGHAVTVASPDEIGPSKTCEHEAIIALHARRSATVIHDSSARCPQTRIVVVLTGTDLHIDLSSKGEAREAVLQSLRLADRILLLEPEGQKLVPTEFRPKTVVILQSSEPVVSPDPPDADSFDNILLGHLREEKDPFLIAQAARRLPQSSKIRVRHYGSALSPTMKSLAEQESENHPRYRWMGAIDYHQAQRRLAQSRLSVLTSRAEGAPSVISESIINDVPILATRICGTVGLLGNDYPGLFEVGDERELARLLEKAEFDKQFLALLQQKTAALKPKFTLKREQQSWANLLSDL